MAARSRTAPAPLRQRIKELRWVKPSELAPDPRNWRRHPPQQAQQLRQMLESVGIVDAAIARETENGLILVDGHLRRDLIGEKIPVLVVDLDEDEAGQVLATLDPLAGMAEADTGALEKLIEQANAPVDWDALFALGAPVDYDSLMPPAVAGAGGHDDGLEMITIAVPKQHAREILRRFEAIVAEYA
ncbi:MAG: ParB/RepB/Spo0J family partition protein [Rhodospirillaceae bacterium]|nr:ParB/RepB/Spo0J family partition protein [Rhodospirillaceae bacterium]